MISDSLGAVCVSHPQVTRDSNLLVIFESLGGYVGCRSHGSPVTAVRWSFLSP
jgi:hypothetical protein